MLEEHLFKAVALGQTVSIGSPSDVARESPAQMIQAECKWAPACSPRVSRVSFQLLGFLSDWILGTDKILSTHPFSSSKHL